MEGGRHPHHSRGSALAVIQTAMPVREGVGRAGAAQHSTPATHLGQAGRCLESAPVQAWRRPGPLQEQTPSRGLPFPAACQGSA